MKHELAHIERTDEGLRELALFAGAGGGILGGHLLGWRCVCAVEWEPYPAAVLAARQNEGILPPFPIWDDVRSFDGTPWRGLVDVVSGGFPCTDISAAGKGAGIDGDASGLWKEMARIIGEVRPRYVFVENSPMLTSRGLGTVLGDLAEMGFDSEWGVLGAHHTGAPHKRDRIWVVARNPNRNSQSAKPVHDEASGVPGMVADASRQREREPTNAENPVPRGGDARAQLGGGSESPGELADTELERLEGHWPDPRQPEEPEPGDEGWWASEPDVGRVADGVASRVERLKAIGNGQVPAVAALAFLTLAARLEERRR